MSEPDFIIILLKNQKNIKLKSTKNTKKIKLFSIYRYFIRIKY